MSIELANQLPGARFGSSSVPQWLSCMADAASRYRNKVWNAIEASGSARAERELRRLAAQHAGNPELAQAYRDAVRNLQVRNS